jgi:LysM repeat protein
MRNVLTVLSVASVLVLAGCGEERQSMRVVQDKQGHAWSDLGSADSPLSNTRVAGPGEIYITIAGKDTLTSVAKKYNTTIAWLIKRNDLENGLPPVGSNLIVPDPNAKR